MSIFDRIVSKLRNIVAAIRDEVGEVRERLEERRQASLAEKLDELAKDKPYKNWRTSVEDLAYLVGEDGSYDGRAELWSGFRMKGEYKGTAAQNIELHAHMLEELPKHGIPWPVAS
jgi:hypothetical protein